MSARQPAVAITGLGTVGAFGVGAEALARGLEGGVARVSEIDRSAGFHRPRGSTHAVLAERPAVLDMIPPRLARRMSWLSRFGVAAAGLALDDAGLSDQQPLGERAAVISATSFGSPEVTQQLLQAILTAGPQAASPFLFPESVANAPAAQIAIACGARGVNLTLSQREAGSLRALSRAALEIRRGRADIVLVAVMDEMHPLLHAVIDRFRALVGNDAESSIARPFDRWRSGFLLAEGATVVVLESVISAAGRGAKIRGYVGASGGGFDASSPPFSWGTGEVVLGTALTRCLSRGGSGLEGIDRVVSAASGSRRGDRLEAAVLARVWGQRELPPILAPLGVTGAYGGGLLASAVLALDSAAAWPTAGFAEPDPEIDLVPHDGSPLEPPRRLLISALAAGGAAAWTLLETP